MNGSPSIMARPATGLMGSFTVLNPGDRIDPCGDTLELIAIDTARSASSPHISGSIPNDRSNTG